MPITPLFGNLSLIQLTFIDHPQPFLWLGKLG